MADRELHDLVARLAANAGPLCAELLPAGAREGAEWRVGSVAGEPGRSMGVHLSGDKAGVWCDWAGGPADRGDALDLVAQVLYRGDKRQAISWARAWLGLGGAAPEGERRPAPAKRAKPAGEEGARKRRRAQHIWLDGAPLGAGLASWRYLAGRAIDLAALGRVPRALRHHEGLVHPETGEVAPALIAAISAADGALAAVHRTFLEEDGAFGWRKLSSVADAKLTLGRYAGGCIRLWRGASGKPLKEAPAGEWVTVSEGIEDGLSIALAAPERRVVAAVSLANIAGLELPEQIAGVEIVGQNDAKAKARDALERAIAGLQRRRLGVRLLRPPVTAKDFNELLQQAAAGRER